MPTLSWDEIQYRSTQTMETILGGVNPGDIVVIRYEGPKGGPGISNC